MSVPTATDNSESQMQEETKAGRNKPAHAKEGGDKTETEAEVAVDEAANDSSGDQADKKVVEDEEPEGGESCRR